MNHCGTCTKCCKMLTIPVLEKPAGRMCQHCRLTKGCQIYETRPTPCREYECFWLITQDSPTPMPKKLRPDRCGVMIAPTIEDELFNAFVEPNDREAWKKGSINQALATIAVNGSIVMISTAGGSDTAVKMFPLGMNKVGTKTVRLSPMDENGGQYVLDDQE